MIRPSFRARTLYVEKLHPKEDRYLAWRPHVSQLFTDKESLLKWINWPKGTPTSEALRDWLASFEPQPTP